MGQVQGIPSGYEYGPAAVIGDVPTQPRKLTNHLFAGPDYSVIHPGIFPHNTEAQEMATLEEWLQFDHRASWGEEDWEDEIEACLDDLGDDCPMKADFPEIWEDRYDREDAREIIEINLERLAYSREKRLELLRNGYHLGDIVTERADKGGIRFKVKVENATDGHNVPTGFTGERLVWLQVTVTDREGTVIFKSGDRDPNGDYRDGESSYVHAGELPLDDQLFTLQSRFLVQNVRGGERERIITIPYSTTALPFLRPSTRSLILTGESTVERNHRKGIEPLGHRWASYRIDGDALTGKGPYRATIRLIVQMIPVNLVTAIQGVGFDYGMSARAVADAVVAGHEVLWERDITFSIDD